MQFCGFNVGLNRPFFLIAGPCVIESEAMCVDIAGAMKDRPELVARRLRVESAAENVTLQMKGLSPSLSASAGYSFGNHSYFDHDQWNAGLTLSVPLTDGGLTKSMVEQARAQLREKRGYLDAEEASYAALSERL